MPNHNRPPLSNAQRACALGLLTAALLAGCHEYDHDYRDRPRERVVIEEHREVREVPPRHRERVLIVEGKHFIEFRAPRPGIATVVDVDRGEDIITVELRPGDHLTVDPDKNKAYVNNRKVYEHDLKSKHLFRIYFDERR
jgi:hypothetical protein